MRIALVLALLGLCACTAPAPPRSVEPEALHPLESALRDLPGELSPGDARRLASAALDTTADLHARYRPLRPPHLGNLAFHLGLRDRALCCHWVEDLLHALSGLGLESVTFHWGVAHFGETLREHSAVVAVPAGAAFGEGLVLDAWRESGRLTYVRADRDRYPWRPHPSDEARLRLACEAGG